MNWKQEIGRGTIQGGLTVLKEKEEKYSYNKKSTSKLILVSTLLLGALVGVNTNPAQASTVLINPASVNVNMEQLVADTGVLKPTNTDKTKVVTNDKTTLSLESNSATAVVNAEFPILIRLLNEEELTNVKFSLVESHLTEKLESKESTLIEFEVPKLKAGELGIEEKLLLKQTGPVKIKVLIKADGISMETEWLNINVAKYLAKIPNVSSPNIHGLPVATLQANQNIKTYKKESNGSFTETGLLKYNSLNSVYGVDGQYYKLEDNLYVDSKDNIRLHISKGDIRENGKNAYDKNGKIKRGLKKGQKYNIYSYSDTMYNIGGGEYIKRESGILMVQGTLKLTSDISLLTKDGKVSRKLKKGEAYKVYSADAKYIQLGGGLKIVNAPTKFKFNKF